jgi:hypothetical protein
VISGSYGGILTFKGRNYALPCYDSYMKKERDSNLMLINYAYLPKTVKILNFIYNEELEEIFKDKDLRVGIDIFVYRANLTRQSYLMRCMR